MDTGLFGEHLIQTLIHAWNYLLLPPLPPSSLIPPVPCIICRDSKAIQRSRPNGIVVPFGATLWLAAVESNSIAQKYRHLADKRTLFKNLHFPFLLISKLDEPYDTENLHDSTNSYRLLSEPVNCFYINFNDITNLQQYLDGKFDDVIHKVNFVESGRLDCFISWFDLYLDEDIKLSSSPIISDKDFNSHCWDQAVFPLQNELIVSKNTTVCIKIKTSGGKLAVDLCDIEKQNKSFKHSISNYEVFKVSQDVVRFLNNSSLMTIFDSIAHTLTNVKTVLDLSPFPILGLNLLKSQTDMEICVSIIKSLNDEDAIRKFAVANEIELSKVNCIGKKDFEAIYTLYDDSFFDIIVLNLVDSTGELKEDSISELPKLRRLLKQSGNFLSDKVCVWGQFIQSDWLKASTEVLSERLIEKYNIAEFINKHKTNYQPDLSTTSIKHSVLSEKFQLIELSIDDLIQNVCKQFCHNIHIINTGVATAMFYWFQYSLIEDSSSFSCNDAGSHINQVAVMIEPKKCVIPGDCIKVTGKYEDASFMFSFE